MTIIPAVLGALATALGIWCAVLGLSAIKHLREADQIDKAIGWSLWWCFDVDRYSKEGRKLCKLGQLLAFAAVVLWVCVYTIER
ncbi:MAG TPA: hypothetical protein PLB25_08505 [Rhodoferax sp.]|nr:hypothetical protein [Rhodoferax sp.]